MESTTCEYGARLKALREKSGFTQAAIANYLHVDQSLISLVEQDKRTLSADALEKELCLFGVTLSDLFGERGASSLSVCLRASSLDENDMEAISAINRIALNLRFLSGLQGEGEE